MIKDFNITVNMTVDELESWLDDPESKKAGTGVGLESGHKIVEILKSEVTAQMEGLLYTSKQQSTNIMRVLQIYRFR